MARGPGASPANAAANDGPASGTIVVTATASNGSTATSSFTYDITNVAPTATFDVPSQVAVGDTYQISLTSPVDVSADLPGLTYSFLCNGVAPVSVTGNTATCAAPTTVGSISASGTITDKDTGSTTYGPTSINVVAALTLTPASHGFGDVVVGQSSAPFQFTLTNDSNVAYAVDQVGFFVTLTSHFQIVNDVTDLCSGHALAAHSACTFYVVFTPQSTGNKSTTLGVQFSGTQPPNPKPQSALTGTGIAPHATINPSTFTFPDTVIGTTSSTTFTIGNDGTSDMHISSIAISGSAKFSVTGGSCDTSTPVAGPSGTCTVEVTFTPTTTDPKTGSLVVTTDGGTVSATLAGTGLPAPVPAAHVDPASPFDFGNVDVNAVPPTQTFSITNTGDVGSTLNITDVSISGSATLTFTPVTLPVGLATGGPHLDIVVTFDPTVAGVKNATLLVTTNAGTVTISLTGTGTGTKPIASLPPGPIDFGHVTVGSSVSTPHVTLTNIGTADLHVSDISITGSGAFTVDAGQCTAAIPSPTGTCDITVAFTPTSAGTKTATLHVTSDGGNRSVDLTGVGDAPQVAAISPTTQEFLVDPTPGSDTRTFTITNTGVGTLTVGTPTLTGSAWFTLGTNTCTAGLAHNATCTIDVTFTANDTADKNGTLHVPSDASNGEVTAALHGTSQAPPVATAQLTPASRDYGNVVIGQTRTRTFTLTNVGSVDLTGITVSISSGPGPFTLAADACIGPDAWLRRTAAPSMSSSCPSTRAIRRRRSRSCPTPAMATRHPTSRATASSRPPWPR